MASQKRIVVNQDLQKLIDQARAANPGWGDVSDSQVLAHLAMTAQGCAAVADAAPGSTAAASSGDDLFDIDSDA